MKNCFLKLLIITLSIVSSSELMAVKSSFLSWVIKKAGGNDAIRTRFRARKNSIKDWNEHFSVTECTRSKLEEQEGSSGQPDRLSQEQKLSDEFEREDESEKQKMEEQQRKDELHRRRQKQHQTQ